MGASMAVRERFSASSFVPDVFEHGVTYWNYVGEPVHYILGAIERQYGGDEARILAEVAGNPRNRLRYALGNGASPPDIDRFMRWLGLEDMFELYGSTEAAISTFRRKGDPRGSVGEVTDPAVQILDESRQGVPAGRARRRRQDPELRGGGGRDLSRGAGHGALPGLLRQRRRQPQQVPRRRLPLGRSRPRPRCSDGRRYLFFDGRTDDWIRKDGENFSAAQVARLLQEHDDVVLAAAYGVPCPVSDEWVMAALKLRPGARFDPQAFFDFCERQVIERGHGPQVVPGLRARRRRVRLHADPEDPGAQPQAGALRPPAPRRRPDLLATRAATPPIASSSAPTTTPCAPSSRPRSARRCSIAEPGRIRDRPARFRRSAHVGRADCAPGDFAQPVAGGLLHACGSHSPRLGTGARATVGSKPQGRRHACR